MARPPTTTPSNSTAARAAVPAPRSGHLDMAPVADALSRAGEDVLDLWVVAQLSSDAFRQGHASEEEVRRDSALLLDALERAVSAGGFDRAAPDAEELGQLLERMSKDRARQGFSPSQTAVAVFSLKEAVGEVLATLHGSDPLALAEELRTLDRFVDGLGLQTFEAFVAARESLILAQQQTMLDLSTPVVKLWDGILALPLIGTLDSGRTQLVMESLLEAIVDTGAQVAIMDITGVPVVDTLVAQHLLKTVAATRLMGAECIISGIRPQIAQTMVHLGLDLDEVVTKASLADAFRVALRRIGSDASTL